MIYLLVSLSDFLKHNCAALSPVITACQKCMPPPDAATAAIVPSLEKSWAKQACKDEMLNDAAILRAEITWNFRWWQYRQCSRNNLFLNSRHLPFAVTFLSCNYTANIIKCINDLISLKLNQHSFLTYLNWAHFKPLSTLSSAGNLAAAALEKLWHIFKMRHH